MSIYDEFAYARVNHIVFEVHGRYLADARRRMQADPNYEESKYQRAVLESERVIYAIRAAHRFFAN